MGEHDEDTQARVPTKADAWVLIEESFKPPANSL